MNVRIEHLISGYTAFKCILAGVFIVSWISANAQLPTLQQKLDGKDRVEEIMNIVSLHYQEIETGIRDRTDEKNYKHWARWGLYMSARTDEQGRLVDADNLVRKAYSEFRQQHRTSVGNWSLMGPTSISGTHGSAIGIGRVDRIAFHPTNPNILYIGTPAGGLFKSTNGGTSWTSLGSNLPSTAISGIVVSHANPDVIYVLTGDGDAAGTGYFIFQAGYWRTSAGVFVSYDAGLNWYPTGHIDAAQPYGGLALEMDPNNANVLLAATSKGLFRTENAGASWSKVLDYRTYEVKFKPGSSTTVYATQDGKFYRSLDGGLTWTQITDFDFGLNYSRIALAVTNTAPARVYLLNGFGLGDVFGGVYLSTNNGASFTRQSNTPNIVESRCDGTGGNNQSDYDLAIGVSHTIVSRVVAGGITTWRSLDTGLTWLNASAGRCSESESTGYVHADVHDIEYNPLNDHLYVCTDGGLIKSTNHGVDWINLSDGIVASQIYLMAGSLVNTNNMIIGLQDNGIKRRGANSTVWDHVLSADGYDCIYNHNGQTTGYLTWNSQVERFGGNGSTLVNITPPGSSGFFPRVTSSINSSAIVLAGYDDIYRSTDSGENWTNVGVSGFWDIQRCPSNNNRFYAAGGNSSFATTGSMWRSDDVGLTWTLISTNPGFPGIALRITDIEVKPNSSNVVWITLGGFSNGNKVFYSSDAGGTWINLSGSLPNIPVNAIKVDNNNNAYLATDIGVFYRAADGDWVPFSHQLPRVPVTDLELYQAEGFIRAATFGRGVWQSDTYTSCVANLSLQGNYNGNLYYEASNTISATGAVYGGQNTKVTFKANGTITFQPGFIGSYGTRVRAYNAPCGVAINEE